MLTDHWAIALLLSQTCAVFLLQYATIGGIQSVRLWDAASASEQQLELERRNYLLGTLVQAALVLQFFGLVLFLVTANDHLPGMLKGAMCATGSLSSSPYGYPALWVKALGILPAMALFFLNRLDEGEPGYPLTPRKYWLLFPLLALAIADWILTFSFFRSLSPDIIATCCSVAYVGSEKGNLFGLHVHSEESVLSAGRIAIGFALAVGVIALASLFSRVSAWLTLAGSLLTAAVGTVALRLFFVRYIYGLPSHECLFDLFWPRYYLSGYFIFGALYAALAAAIYRVVLQLSTRYLQRPDAASFIARHDLLARRWLATALLAALLWPAAFWFFWEGTL